MNKFRTGAAIAALIAAVPVSAQLVGNVGAGLGGGLGGSLGGVGGSVGATLGGSVDRDFPRTRGVVAASERGLARVTPTERGVPVFVRAPRTARIAAVPYPVYRPGAYYGGPDTVVLTRVEVDGYMDRQQRQLERAVRGSGTRIVRRGDDLIVQLPADVTFAFDKADIQSRFYGTLNAVARTLDDYPGTDVQVVGHTDSVGSDSYNLALSERRGRNVADFLATRSVEPQRMVVEAAGEYEPVASNATVGGRAANRRVEIVLHPRAA